MYNNIIIKKKNVLKEYYGKLLIKKCPVHSKKRRENATGFRGVTFKNYLLKNH